MMVVPRRSAQDVETSRSAVIDTAVRTASVEGLEGLTIGRLAEATEMSKSGLFGLFGSKEGLQLATLEAGNELFLARVWEPVREIPRGRERLLELCERWIAFHRRETLPGGCFMTMAAVEWDSRSGPVHDAVAASVKGWLALLAREVDAAVSAGELPDATDPADTAFQLNALASAASWNHQLSGDPAVLEQGLRCMRATLGAR